jgi:hypothetical protein
MICRGILPGDELVTHGLLKLKVLNSRFSLVKGRSARFLLGLISYPEDGGCELL